MRRRDRKGKRRIFTVFLCEKSERICIKGDMKIIIIEK